MAKMGRETEQLYNQLGKSYEESYVENPGQAQIIDIILQRIPPQSKILDVGCGTGRPMAEAFANAGHEVHGIDSSQTMLEIAKSQVKGHFEKHKMTEYNTKTKFDVVLGSFSLFHITCDETYSMIFRFAEWLKPGGLLMVATILADYQVKDRSLFDPSGECVRRYPHTWMNNAYEITEFTRKGWMSMFEKAGLSFEKEVYSPWAATADHQEEVHYLTVVRKTEKETLFGPYPIPSCCGRVRKSNPADILPLSKRLSIDETESILEILNVDTNKRVLDTSIWRRESLNREVAKRGGSAVIIEPEPSNDAVQSASDQQVELLQATPESLPFPDNRFDAVVATWSLQYANDFERSLHEMARVADSSNSHSQIIISQASPDNNVVNMLNKAAVSLSQNAAPEHHGYLLQKASQVLAGHGFADISLDRVELQCSFHEQEISERCARAAEVLARFFYADDTDYEKIRQGLIPELELHFLDSPHSIGFSTVVLVARPTKT